MKYQLQKQRGVALLMVLIVITTLSALLYPLWQAQRMAMVRAQASQAQLQAWAVLISTQDWVKSALKFDAQQSKTDSLQELWAQPMPPMPFDGGTIGGWLEDAQGRLNVNRLANPDPVQRAQALEQFNRLCQVLTLECPFWSAVADWVDSDDIPSTGGAETATYLSMQPARRAANQPIVTVEELQVVQGVSPIILQRLTPYLIALPQDFPVNINTAKMPVMMALAPWMTEDQAKLITASQQSQPFESLMQVSELLRKNSVQDAEINLLVNERQLSVATQHFLLHAQADYGGRRWQAGALIKRDAGRSQVLSRWLEEDQR
jgi:general secretion pathway protein K